MEIIRNNFQVLLNGNLDDQRKKKLIFSVKYYLARACNTVRNREIIQLNHYIDDLYLGDNSKYKRIVLSPSRVPFPIAYLVNYSVIKRDESVFFCVNDKGGLDMHPYEHMIPLCLALCSGVESLSSEDTQGPIGISGCNSGRLFLCCVLWSGEISYRLMRDNILTPLECVCVAAVTTVATVWGLDTHALVRVLADILRSRHTGIDMQACLQAISVASYSPTYSSSSFSPSKQINRILSVLSEKIEITAHYNSFPGLDRLQFCLLGMDPTASVLSAAIYRYCSSNIKFTIQKNILNYVIENSNELFDWNENAAFVMGVHNKLERFVSDNQIRDADNGPFYGPKPLDIKPNVEEIKIEVNEMEDNRGFSSITMLTKGQGEKYFPIDELISILSSLEPYIESHIKWRLQSVIGVDATRIICENLDEIHNQHSLTEALSLVFERPGLD